MLLSEHIKSDYCNATNNWKNMDKHFKNLSDKNWQFIGFQTEYMKDFLRC